MDVFAAAAAADMDGGEDQNSSTATNGNPQTSGNSRTPQISQMSLYERQAVQVRVGDDGVQTVRSDWCKCMFINLTT